MLTSTVVYVPDDSTGPGGFTGCLWLDGFCRLVGIFIRMYDIVCYRLSLAVVDDTSDGILVTFVNEQSFLFKFLVCCRSCRCSALNSLL